MINRLKVTSFGDPQHRETTRICPKVTNMGFIIAHRIDYDGVEALRDQRHIPNKN